MSLCGRIVPWGRRTALWNLTSGLSQGQYLTSTLVEAGWQDNECEGPRRGVGRRDHRGRLPTSHFGGASRQFGT
jgi:hypothetical protein